MAYQDWPRYPYSHPRGSYYGSPHGPRDPRPTSPHGQEGPWPWNASEQEYSCDEDQDDEYWRPHPGMRWRSSRFGKSWMSKEACSRGCATTLREALCRNLGSIVEIFTEANSDVVGPQDRIGILKCVSEGIVGIRPVEGPMRRKVFFALNEIVGFQVGPPQEEDSAE